MAWRSAVEQADEADDVAAGASGVTSRDRLGGDLAAYRQTVRRTQPMMGDKAKYSFGPVVFIGVGWLWQYIGYRLAFGSTSPEYGFYRRPGGHVLRLWLSEIPTIAIGSMIILNATWVAWRFIREKQRLAAVVYLLLCLVLLAIFVTPGAWMIDIPGRGEFFI